MTASMGSPGKYIVQEGPVGYAAHIEAAALEGLPVALGQVVHHHHVGPRSIRAATQWLPIYRRRRSLELP